MTAITLNRFTNDKGEAFFAIQHPGVFQPVGEGDLAKARAAFDAMKARCAKSRAKFIDLT